MSDHVTEALDAITTADSKRELDTVYASHITALILNGTDRADLEQVARAWQARSLQLLDEGMGDDR